ncbi:MAG: hypothetical protein KTR15_00270 [Phycisphaeraceae bacterium]|nr:hypothetical protein [Phycisphaeraceae bacterium]
MNIPLIARLIITSAMLAPATTPAHADGKTAIPADLKERVEADGWSQQWHDELYDHEDAAVGAALRQMLRAKRDAAALESGLVAHEWGAMQHHVGTSTSEFDLIGEDQSDLPSFVKVWADQPMLRPQVIRKPVLYFYTKQQRKVSVTVRFPEGVLTQWYPDVGFFLPQRDDRVWPKDQKPPTPRNGTLSWREVELNPGTDKSKFAEVDKDHPWWHIARDTDAVPVRVVNRDGRGAQKPEEVERFLFYRGSGNYKPMVLPTRNEPGKDLSVTVPFSQIDLQGVFLVRVNDSGATIAHAPVLRAEATMALGGPGHTKPTTQAAETAKAQLIESLEAAGLFPKEAAGLVKIWGDDMFTTPGERLLYLMPSNEVERVLPLDIQPAPNQAVRTLIAWVELSTPEAEKQVMDLVKKLGSEDEKIRSAADKELRRLDRFAESILQRLAGSTTNQVVKQRIEQILTALEQERRQGKAPKTRNNP